jgi:CRP/FNR family transcriptional regulator, anaerobic regulatory protein
VRSGCLAERIGRAIRLTPGEEQALQRIEEQQRSLRRGSVIRREHGRSADLVVVQEGWLFSFVLLDDGSRQILRIHLPGDLAGSMEETTGTSALAALTDVRISQIGRAELGRLFADHPRLAAMLFTIAQDEQAALMLRMASLGRTSARARVAALLIDTLDRLRSDGVCADLSFLFPLTQEEIGDATGLTAVHVNRMLRVLAENGMIERTNATLLIRDEHRLRQMARQASRRGRIDLGWLPEARG